MTFVTSDSTHKKPQKVDPFDCGRNIVLFLVPLIMSMSVFATILCAKL